MKRIATLALFLITIQAVFAQQTASVTVVVDSIVQPTGKIFAAVYNTKEGYKTSVPFKTSTKKITDSNIKLFFNLPVNKSFAIAIFQDLNDNNLLDTKGSMKIPVEPFGFSNNTIGILGPPRYNKMSFKVVSDTTLIINIITDTKGYLKRTK